MARAKKSTEAIVEATPVALTEVSQPKQNGGIDMANKYLVCNTSKVKATNTGGRLHSAVLETEVQVKLNLC